MSIHQREGSIKQQQSIWDKVAAADTGPRRGKPRRGGTERAVDLLALGCR